MSHLTQKLADWVEALEKDVGIGDSQSATDSTVVAATLSDFATKWSSDEKKLWLSVAKPFYDDLVAGKYTTVAAAGGALLAAVTSGVVQSVTMTLDDAVDAVRVHALAGS